MTGCDLPNTLSDARYPGYVLVTGAGGGIGLALVDYLLSLGVREIVCQYRSKSDELMDVLEKYNLSPDDHCFYAELTDEAQIKGLREQANDSFGRIWGLINLAGASTNSISWRLSKDDFVNVMNANVLTTFLCLREFIPDLRARAGGRIINVSSVVAFSGAIGAAHYCAAKAGVIGLTKAVALELASKEVTVNALALGYFDYGLINDVSLQLQDEIKQRTPLRRFGKINEIGGIVEFLLSEHGGFATGQVFHINGGIYL